MKIKGLFDQIFSMENLYAAYKDAYNGRRYNRDVLLYGDDVWTNLRELQKKIYDGTYRIDRYYIFYVYEPKKRMIMSIVFEHRIVQWAIYRVVNPLFVKGYIRDTYGCIPGRGSIGAMRRLKGWMSYLSKKEGKWFYLKLDISKYFYRINHHILIEILSKKLRDDKLLTILKRIINCEHTPFGLPAGKSPGEVDPKDMLYDVENVLDLYYQEFKERGLSDAELGSWEFTLEEKKTEDWSQKWKEKWDVTHVTDRIAVVPDWIEYKPKDNEIVIKLEPGCAFGTGTHQTTQLCMKALEKYMKKDDRVADIGMGSGILSILAKKLGASYVYGCDTDETVIDVARENAQKNGEECKFELGSADKINDKFDFVCANILHFVLAEIMGDLKNIMKDNAYLSLSGILDEKKQMVIDAIKRENLKMVDEIHQDQK